MGEMAIVFYATAWIIIISVLLAIFVVIKPGKNDKMKEENRYAKGSHGIINA